MAGKSRSLGSLLVSVGADTRALDAGLKSATENVKQFGNRTSSTARKAEGSFQKMGRGGFALSEGLSRLGGFLPGLTGFLSASAIGSMAFGSIQKGFQEAAEVSPAVLTIKAKREQFRFEKALKRGEENPRLAELLSGGFMSGLEGGFMNVIDEIDQDRREGDLLGYLGRSLPIGQLLSFIQGARDENTAALEEVNLLPIDQARLERNRLELSGPKPVQGTGGAN